MKRCSKCKEEKSESEFYIRSKVSGSLYAQCKSCMNSKSSNDYLKRTDGRVRRKVSRLFDPVSGMKQCNRCLLHKPIALFSRNRTGSLDGYQRACKDCNSSYLQTWFKVNKERIYERTRIYSKTRKALEYGKSWKKRDSLERKEKLAGRSKPNYCEACGALDCKIVFDHNHATGAFRGWICSRCNHALGHCGDDVTVLRKLIEYLERNGSYAGHEQKYKSSDKLPREPVADTPIVSQKVRRRIRKIPGLNGRASVGGASHVRRGKRGTKQFEFPL